MPKPGPQPGDKWNQLNRQWTMADLSTDSGVALVTLGASEETTGHPGGSRLQLEW